MRFAVAVLGIVSCALLAGCPPGDTWSSRVEEPEYVPPPPERLLRKPPDFLIHDVHTRKEFHYYFYADEYINEDIVTADADRTDGSIDSEGRSVPAEMLPGTIVSEGVRFDLGPTGVGEQNAVGCRGQAISLPSGDWSRVYLLAAATEDTDGRFLVDG